MFPATHVLQISSGATSSSFSLPGSLNFIVFGRTGSSRTAALEFSVDGGSSWIDSGISATTSTSAHVFIDSDDLSAIAGLSGSNPDNDSHSLGHTAEFRINLGASDSCSIYVYSRDPG